MVSASEPKIKSKQDQGVMSESALEKTEKKTSWVPNWWKSNEEVPPSTNEETVPPSVNVKKFHSYISWMVQLHVFYRIGS